MNVRGPGRLGREGAGGPEGGGKRRPEGTRWGGEWDFRRQSPFSCWPSHSSPGPRASNQSVTFAEGKQVRWNPTPEKGPSFSNSLSGGIWEHFFHTC